MDLGLPPTIVSIITPDTIKIIELGLDTLFSINATVTDEDGLNNISTVKLKTFFSHPDSIILDTTYYALYDDGNLDSLFYSGDSFKGDGIFSNKILLDPYINIGIYKWVFTDTDLDNRVSENLETRVVIQ